MIKSHIAKIVQCKMCPEKYCIDCQDDGCKCGCKEFLYDHGDVKGEGRVSEKFEWSQTDASQYIVREDAGGEGLTGSIGVNEPIRSWTYETATAEPISQLTVENLRTAAEGLRNNAGPVGSSL